MKSTYVRIATECLKEAAELEQRKPGSSFDSPAQEKGYYAKLEEIRRLTVELQAKRNGGF